MLPTGARRVRRRSAALRRECFGNYIHIPVIRQDSCEAASIFPDTTKASGLDLIIVRNFGLRCVSQELPQPPTQLGVLRGFNVNAVCNLVKESDYGDIVAGVNVPGNHVPLCRQKEA